MKKYKESKEIRKTLSACCSVSEKQRIEDQIKEREEKLTGIFQSSPDAIVVVGTDEKIVECNNKTLDLLGYKTNKELIGKNAVSFLIKEDQPRARKNIKKAFREGMLNNVEYNVASSDGKTHQVLISVSRLRDAFGKTLGLIVIVRDVTEYKRAEEALRESEIKFRLAFENAQDAIVWADTHTGNLIDCNRAAELLFEKPKSQIVGRHQTSLHPLDKQDYCSRMFKKQVCGNPLSIELPIITKSGKIKIATIASSLVNLKDREIVQGVFRDVTEDRVIEDNLRKLNRTLKAISDSNHALMHATDEKEYLRDVCRIVVEDCGYSLVWIGFADNDKNKRVRPVAQAGFEKGYLGNLIVTWADNKYGHGPTGTAIRTQKPAICKNMLTDFNFRPWRKEAVRRGHISSASLPLVSGNNAFGAISIYSRESDSFTKDEISLLGELADDLAYGIMTIRLRNAHKQAEGNLRRTHDYLESLFNYANAPIICWDKNFRITRFNHAFERLANYKADEVIGRKLSMLFPESDRQGSLNNIKRALKGERWEVVEIPILRKGGGIRIALWNSANIYAEDGKALLATIAQGQDITARKQAEEELRKANNELEIRVRERTAELVELNRHVQARNAILKLIGTKSSRKEYLDSLAKQLKAWSGCGCVGIRVLDAEGRIPYDSYVGFSQEFWKSENPLSIKEDHCVCIRAVKGSFEPQDFPFITKANSFYLNNAVKFIEGLSDLEKNRFRGVCMKSGFNSIAVIPVVYKDRITGVLHFADERENMVPPETVEFFEFLSPLIGEGIHKFNLEDKIERDHSILEAFFKHAITPFVFLDAEFNFIRVNEAYAKAWGRDVSEFPGHNIFEFSPNEETKKIFRQVVETKTPFQASARAFTFPDHPEWGVTYWDWALVPILNNKGKIEFLVFSLKDVTEHRVAQEKLFITQKELESARRLSDIGVLAATVAHELRNPLGVIRTAAYNIKRKAQNPLLDSHLENIEKKILESDQIINNLLFYSRLKMPHYEPVRICDILNESIDFVDRRFKGSKVSVVKKINSVRKEIIDADPVQMSELFNNILNNSYDACVDRNGVIEIRIVKDKRGNIEMSFKDNGVGIDKEDLKSIFEPFFTTKAKGTGLGLTVCNQIVSLHQGKISIDSEKGKGTRVAITIPAGRNTDGKETLNDR